MDLAGSSLVLEAQRLYSEKKYDQAVASFTKALSSPSAKAKGDRIYLLDLRIGAYVKLGKLDLALSDAKLMIRHDRSDGRGYLRCGQLERLAENYSNALQWYQHGLKNIVSTGEMRTYMVLQLEKTERLAATKIVASKPVDPMTALPIELVEMILAFFDYKQHVAILRVSKAWKQMLIKRPPLCDSIDFRNTTKKITYLMLSSSLKRLSKYPKKVILSDLSDATAKSMRQHLDRWVNFRTLEHLEVHDEKINISGIRFEKFNLRSIATGSQCQIPLPHVYSILRSCQSLRVAKFANIVDERLPVHRDFQWTDPFSHEQLEQLEMFGVNLGARLRFFTKSFEHFVNLRKLTCRMAAIEFGGNDDTTLDLSGMRQLTELDLSDTLMPCFMQLPASLSTLKLARTYLGPPRQCHAKGSDLPDLRVLDVFGCHGAEPSMLRQTFDLNGLGVIRELAINLDVSSLLLLEGFIDLVVRHHWLVKLEALRLCSQSLNDSHAWAFVEGIPKLRKLRLENAAISGVFLVEVLTVYSSQLEHVVLVDCAKISHDGIEWGRKRGVRIDVRNTTGQNLGSRPLRTLE